jgi:hypothetical protein
MRELRFASVVAVVFGATLVGAAQVGTQPSATGLTATPTTANAGTPITANATISPVLSVSGNPSSQRPTAVPKPTGTITFFDGTTQLGGGPIPITAASGFSSSTFQQTFGTPDPTLASLNGLNALASDLNGDGIPDILLYAPQSNGLQTEIQAFLSGPAGYAVLPPQSLNVSGTPAVIDENGDGVVDLLIGTSIAFGNGDGTFQQATPLPFLTDGSATYVADVTGDGNPDIIAVTIPAQPTTPGPVSFTASVYANAGGGAFNYLGTVPLATSNVSCPCASLSVPSLNFIDLNGDGFLDMLAQTISVPEGSTQAAPSLTMLLNNGNGTYANAVQITYPSVFDQGALEPTNLLTADFNGDGKADLLLVLPSEIGLGQGPEYQTPIIFMPGNGDGSFGTPIVSTLSIPLSAGGKPTGLVPSGSATAGDADQDGHLDLVFGSGAVAQGDGTGAFTLGAPLPLVLPAPAGNAIASSPVLLTNLARQVLPSFVFLNFAPPPGTPAQAVFTPNVNSVATFLAGHLGVGTHTISAQYSGDAVYAASTSPQVTVKVGQASTTITISSSANPAYVSQSVTYNVSVTSAASIPTGTVTFTAGSTTIGTLTLNAAAPATFLSSTTTAGSETITATYSGDANNLPSSATLTEVVVPAFNIQAGTGSSATITVNSGQAAVAAISVVGAANFTGAVTLSCMGLPAHASCIFNPGSVALSGGQSQTTLVTVSTSGTTTSNATPGPVRPGKSTVAYGLALGSLLLFGPGALSRRGKLLLLAAAFCVLGIAAVGCGGNSTSQSTPPPAPGSGGAGGPGGGSSSTITPAGSYPFTIVATSGGLQTTASYTLAVQ